MESKNTNPTKIKAPAWFNHSDSTENTFVLTTVAVNSVDQVTPEITAILSDHNITIDEKKIINNKAAHFYFQAMSEQAWALFERILNTIKNADTIVQPLTWQAKKLLICDMDMTIVDAETLDEVAELVGIGDAVAAITEQAMRGEIDFHGALRERISLLKGQPRQAFLDVLATCQLNPGAKKLISKANANGLTTILISGGFADVAEPIGEQLGFDAVYSNRLALENDILTGEVIDPIVDSVYKRTTLVETIEKQGLSAEQCCAIGDGANDIPMLNTACLGIAYQGKPLTKQATPYQINVTDLETALSFMGLD